MRRHGRPLPDWIAEQPRLRPHHVFYWQAFHALGTCRAQGGGPGPIPWTAVRSYAICEGLGDPDEFADFERIIAAMDAVFLEHIAEWQKTEGRRRKR